MQTNKGADGDSIERGESQSERSREVRGAWFRSLKFPLPSRPRNAPSGGK